MFQSYPEGCGEGCVTEGHESNGDKDTVCRTLVMHSDDGGDTWSTPREVTREVKRAVGATSVATGPGVGIQLAHGAHAGRLVMPFNEGPYDRWRVYAAFSDDGGDSWRIGAVAPNAPKGLGNEVQMFERADGAVVLNARQHLGAKRRTAAVSTDGGATWSQLADVPELPDPQCMGGVLALGGGTVVFTGCDSESRRALGTVWISRDDGRSWPEKMLVEPGGFAYSVPIDLGLGADGARMIGVLHEGAGYKRIEFARVSLPSAPPAATPPVR
jgi:sialidase-1